MKGEREFPARCPQNFRETLMTSDEDGDLLKGFYYCGGDEKHKNHVIAFVKSATSWFTRGRRGKDDIRDFGILVDFPINDE